MGMRAPPLPRPGDLPRALPPSADAGAPVYFYEFQHRPHCLQDRKPAFVRADHTDEIRFVFGGAFLEGDVVMFGEELALGGRLLSQGHWDELGGHRLPTICTEPLAWPKLCRSQRANFNLLI